jgi:hypothetical protein
VWKLKFNKVSGFHAEEQRFLVVDFMVVSRIKILDQRLIGKQTFPQIGEFFQEFTAFLNFPTVKL